MRTTYNAGILLQRAMANDDSVAGAERRVFPARLEILPETAAFVETWCTGNVSPPGRGCAQPGSARTSHARIRAA